MGLLDIDKNINNIIPRDLYDQYQLSEIENGIQKGLDIFKYSNPAYGCGQMRQIRTFLEKGIDITEYVGPQFSANCMYLVGRCLENNASPEPLLNPVYNDAQQEQIYYGIINELDINEYCDPSNSVEYMFNKRVQLMKTRQEQVDIWDYLI